MKKVVFIIMLLLLLFLSVCFIQYDTFGKNSELETEILSLKEILIQERENIDDLNEKVGVLQTRSTESFNELMAKYEALEFLVTKIPDLTKREGYIKSIKKEKDQIILEVQFAERRKNNESPKGYIIKKNEVKTYPLNEDATYYLLDGNSIMHVNLEEFLMKAIEYDRYYSFYLGKEEIILIQQLLLP